MFSFYRQTEITFVDGKAAYKHPTSFIISSLKMTCLNIYSIDLFLVFISPPNAIKPQKKMDLLAVLCLLGAGNA